jgi:hypothetical protein
MNSEEYPSIILRLSTSSEVKECEKKKERDKTRLKVQRATATKPWTNTVTLCHASHGTRI